MDRDEVIEELRWVQADFHRLVSTTSADDLRRRSSGTRWSNRQLLFHMVFGYAVVRTLLPLVHALGRLGCSRGFAATLNAGYRPFHLINYLGSCGGGQLLAVRAQAALLDRTIGALQHELAAETDTSLALSMHFPTAWDPYFTPIMSVLDVYHFGTQHYEHHRRQLDLPLAGRTCRSWRSPATSRSVRWSRRSLVTDEIRPDAVCAGDGRAQDAE